MAEQVSFKTRVKETAISIALDYYSYYVCRDYLLISDAFKCSPYYIVRAEKDNYLHLVGVSTLLSATAFFDKCLNGTLEESDFEIGFSYSHPSRNSLKSSLAAFILFGSLVFRACSKRRMWYSISSLSSPKFSS